MPQMSPINWLLLFILFTIIFIMFNVMNYYSFKPKLPKSKLMNFKILSESLNWKW